MITGFEWIPASIGVVWGTSFMLALPVFLVRDTRNNWAHGNTGVFGYIHTLARVPPLALIAPLYLALLIGQTVGFWRE